VNRVWYGHLKKSWEQAAMLNANRVIVFRGTNFYGNVLWNREWDSFCWICILVSVGCKWMIFILHIWKQLKTGMSYVFFGIAACRLLIIQWHEVFPGLWDFLFPSSDGHCKVWTILQIMRAWKTGDYFWSFMAQVVKRIQLDDFEVCYTTFRVYVME
jgi:hypothetical protein